jgi:hypothetical protein
MTHCLLVGNQTAVWLELTPIITCIFWILLAMAVVTSRMGETDNVLGRAEVHYRYG